MRTVVFGAPGQLGRDLCPRLAGDVIRLGRPDVDLTDVSRLRAKLNELRPNVVVNCAAYNFVDKARSEPESAFAVNAWAVRTLAETCRELDCTLVQFSTDYVFGLDDARTAAWTEADAPVPVSAYGFSKLEGEDHVRCICPKHFVIRTCGLYGVRVSGGKGGNFVETMLRLAGQGKPLRVVNDQRCTPSYTADVAKATVDLIATGAFGVYHVSNAGDCTWYEFAREILRVAGVAADLTPISTADFGAAARRPAYSVLSNDKLGRLGISKPRHWTEALAEYLVVRGQRD